MSRSSSGDASSSRPLSKQSSSKTRKTLPQIPNNEPIALPPYLSSAGDASFQPFFLEYALMAEYNMIQRQKISGVYVVPSAKSALVWNGVVFVRQGLYQDGVFRFSIEFAASFPDSDCPSVVFRPVIYHPNVDPESGSLDVKRVFAKWRRNINHVWQVLLFVRRIFLKLETKDALNTEAAELYESDCQSFQRHVSECVAVSRQTVYNDPDPDDAHAIRFSQWDEAVHSSAKQQLSSTKSDSGAEVSSSIMSPPFTVSSTSLGFGVTAKSGLSS